MDGAALTQIDAEDSERTVAFSACSKYAIVEKEAL